MIVEPGTYERRMVSRRQACFLAAAHEIEQARASLRDRILAVDIVGLRKEKRSYRAAEMRARRILGACNGSALPRKLELLVRRFQTGDRA